MTTRERTSRLRTWLAERLPRADFWLGSARALRVAAWLLLAVGVVWFAAGPFSPYKSLGILFGAAVLLAFALGVGLAGAAVARLPATVRWSLALYVAVALAVLAGNDRVTQVSAAVVGAGAMLLGGGLAVARRRGWRWQSTLPTAAGALLLTTWLVAFLLPEWPTEEDITWVPMSSPRLTLEDPGLPGPLGFTLQHYGSGTDPRRPEFGADVDHVTAPVDGSKLLDGWEGRSGWGRTHYWGTTAEALPIQGRAWIPDGDGPSPIVLIVHGNHGMEDFSDPGYAYLGELFASRGVLTVSVDENFLNSSYADALGAPDAGLDEENDARGWLLLKHLEQWRTWNETPDHPLSGKADLERVVLIGHSRGGEAVSEAAVFNRLPAYPDDATLEFDFGFGLRGVIAIAPVDTQYDPRNGPTTMRDTNYLVIHGSHDGDVTSYAGYAAYGRARFDACASCFKAGFYLVGANHGQFNTSWGRRDAPLPPASALNLRHLMDGEDQRAVAKTLFSAFLEVVLFDNARYKPWLAAPDRGPQLLPDGARYLTQFRDAGELVLADFTEDDDVSTGTLEGVRISADGLALWREQELELKWRKADSTAAVIGWDVRPPAQPDAEDDEAEYGEVSDGEPVGSSAPPRYRLALPGLAGSPQTTLNLSLAPSTATPGDAEGYEPPGETDFSLVLEDADGNTAALHLGVRRPLVERIDPKVFKLHALQDKRSEIVFQRYRFELAEWAALNPALDLDDLRALALVFDRTEASSIILEQVTWSPDGF